jgi:hypothetical protein
VHTFDLILLWIATVGQVLFVLLWATQRWWSSTVGQALMAKSLSLALILVASVWSYYRGPLPGWAGRSLFLFIAVAITAQLVALVWEIHQARREFRQVRSIGRP